MRLFVAAPVPGEVRAAVLAAIEGVRGDDRVTWTRPEGWHCTLAFVGEVGDGAGGDVGDGAGGDVGDGAGGDVGDGAGGEVGDGAGLAAVVEAAWSAARSTNVGAVVLRTGRTDLLARGSALVLDLSDEPDGAIAHLGTAVQRALVAAGLDVAERRVRPHLTLARARRGHRVPADVVAAAVVPPLEWTVSHLEVVRSVLGRGPARYLPLATVPLPG